MKKIAFLAAALAAGMGSAVSVEAVDEATRIAAASPPLHYRRGKRGASSQGSKRNVAQERAREKARRKARRAQRRRG